MPAARGNSIPERLARFLAGLLVAAREKCLMLGVEIAVDDQSDVALPHRQCVADFALVRASVVNAAHARAMAGSMIQNLLDHMRRDADVAHARCDCPS